MSSESELALPVPSQPFSLPLAHPDPNSKPAPPRPELTSAQATALADLIEYFNNDLHLPTTVKALKHAWRLKSGGSTRSFGNFFRGSSTADDEEAVMKPLDERERCYWSKEAFLRCLRATKWVYLEAVKRAEETLVWRREFAGGVEDGLSAELVSHEGETGKELILGYDVNLRPVLYMHPYRQNTETSMSQINFVVWCLERAIDLCPPSVPVTDTIALCIDFGANRTGDKTQPTSIMQAKRVLDILQTYYCERLGRAICVNIPGFFWPFYKLVGPFVDPVTKDKIRFLDGKANATDLIPASQLQALFGGEVDFQYDHATYFPALTKLCNERKAANLERWRKYGDNKCGLSEAVIRGAVTPDGQPGEAAAASSASTIVAGEQEKAPALSALSPTLSALSGGDDEFVDAQEASVGDLEKGVESVALEEKPTVTA
ncbi:hypothetical protein RQP46_004382 [Phenoliferia psychrophenolica]